MKTILITGFEPFGDDMQNASWEAVSALPCEIEKARVEKLCLPVVFGKAAKLTIDKATEIGADYIICVGQAGGRSLVTPECKAFNERFARIPDNDGASPQGEKICEFGPDEETSSFDMNALIERLKAHSCPVELSYDAGRYVCNDLLYSVLHRFKGTGVKCMFVHVPYFDLQDVKDKPSLPLDVITGTLENIVKAALAEDETDYKSMCAALEALTDGVESETTNLANAASLVFNSMKGINWAGFYISCEDELILGPFCGKPACVKIPYGRGVCGTSAVQKKTLVVDDVHKFDGHIACDSASNSEIVVPLIKNGCVVGVLDIDSPNFDRFTDADKTGLERFCDIVVGKILE